MSAGPDWRLDVQQRCDIAVGLCWDEMVVVSRLMPLLRRCCCVHLRSVAVGAGERVSASPVGGIDAVDGCKLSAIVAAAPSAVGVADAAGYS